MGECHPIRREEEGEKKEEGMKRRKMRGQGEEEKEVDQGQRRPSDPSGPV